MTDDDAQPDESTGDEIVCHRCGAMRQQPGPAFYIIRIEAFAEHSDETATLEEIGHDIQTELRYILEEARGLSAHELMDQVYRRMVLHLCPRCYRRWIDNPVAGDG
jgi:hypothetical protein